MATTHSLDDLIKRRYPNAMTETAFREKMRDSLAGEYHIDISKMLLATSVCADDIIAVRESETRSLKARLKNDFLGPFSMGGLAGIPYSGLTGTLTIAHHIPEGGSVLIAYGPHIGMTDQGDLGKLLRPGQSHESAACGALTLALKHFHSSPGYQPAYDDDDTEQMTLERRLLPYREQILTAENPLQTATDIAYTIIHELIHRYIRAQKMEFNCEHLALAGGVVINTSPQHEDYIDLRHFSVWRVAEL